MLNLFNYHCPHCKKQLNKNKEVTFLIKRENKERGLIFLSPEPQSYGYRTEPEMMFNKNEVINFICLYCDKSLISKKYPKFVKIHLKITSKVFIDVFFSRIHGVHKTYVGIEDFEETYGNEMKL